MVPLMSESLDRPLNVLERVKLKLHFIVCTWCSRYLEQITLIRSAVTMRSEETGSHSTGLSHEARERLTNSLKDVN